MNSLSRALKAKMARFNDTGVNWPNRNLVYPDTFSL
jgi:hypothetical protein